MLASRQGAFTESIKKKHFGEFVYDFDAFSFSTRYEFKYICVYLLQH